MTGAAVDSSSPVEATKIGVHRVPVPPEVIVVAVRWYLRYNRSYRDVEQLLIERGVEVDHVTVFRWVQRPMKPWPGADEQRREEISGWSCLWRSVPTFGK